MDPKAIIQAIERNREIMQAQVQKLGEFSPRLEQLSLAQGCDTSEGVASLLNAMMRGHLQGAADAMRTIADVESMLREQSCSTGPQGHRPSEIIDGEAVVIKTGE